MTSRIPHFLRCAAVAALALASVLLSACASSSPKPPYVASEPPRGWSLFTRPSEDNAADQWTYVQQLQREGSLRKAANQAEALQLFWPTSPEAPRAQLLHARLLDARDKHKDAFEAYQLLIEKYPESCDYEAIVADQLRLANAVCTSRLATCWGLLPGFEAPSRAIPLFQAVIDEAPEGPGAPEAAYRIALAQEDNYEYEKAIDAFYQVVNRFPESPYAVQAALGQARCHITLADDAPYDARAREAAIAACDFVLKTYPKQIRKGPIEADRQRLIARREADAYARCLYYDKTLKNFDAARLEYKSFVALYPNSEYIDAARARLEQLQAANKE